MDFYRVLDSLPSPWRRYFVTPAVTGLRLEDLCPLIKPVINTVQNTVKTPVLGETAGGK